MESSILQFPQHCRGWLLLTTAGRKEHQKPQRPVQHESEELRELVSQAQQKVYGRRRVLMELRPEPWSLPTLH